MVCCRLAGTNPADLTDEPHYYYKKWKKLFSGRNSCRLAPDTGFECTSVAVAAVAPPAHNYDNTEIQQ